MLRVRGRVVRSGMGGETAKLLLIPVFIMGVLGSILFMTFNPTVFPDDPLTPTGPIDANTSAAADQALRSARAYHATNPSEARSRYQAIITQYPGTAAAGLAKQYLREL